MAGTRAERALRASAVLLLTSLVGVGASTSALRLKYVPLPRTTLETRELVAAVLEMQDLPNGVNVTAKYGPFPRGGDDDTEPLPAHWVRAISSRFYTNIDVGSPPQRMPVLVDTGSQYEQPMFLISQDCTSQGCDAAQWKYDVSVSNTVTGRPSASPSSSVSPSASPSTSQSPSASLTPSASQSPSQSASPSATASATATASVSFGAPPSTTPTPTPTVSITSSPSVTATVTPTSSSSVTPSGSMTPTVTPSKTPSTTPSISSSMSPSPSDVGLLCGLLGDLLCPDRRRRDESLSSLEEYQASSISHGRWFSGNALGPLLVDTVTFAPDQESQGQLSVDASLVAAEDVGTFAEAHQGRISGVMSLMTGWTCEQNDTAPLSAPCSLGQSAAPLLPIIALHYDPFNPTASAMYIGGDPAGTYVLSEPMSQFSLHATCIGDVVEGECMGELDYGERSFAVEVEWVEGDDFYAEGPNTLLIDTSVDALLGPAEFVRSILEDIGSCDQPLEAMPTISIVLKHSFYVLQIRPQEYIQWDDQGQCAVMILPKSPADASSAAVADWIIGDRYLRRYTIQLDLNASMVRLQQFPYCTRVNNMPYPGQTWPEAPLGATVSQPCPPGWAGSTVTRQCKQSTPALAWSAPVGNCFPPPQPPLAVTVIDIRHNTFTIQWTRIQSINNIGITYGLKLNGVERTITAPIVSIVTAHPDFGYQDVEILEYTEATLVHPETEYAIAVVARRAGTASNSSQPLTFATLPRPEVQTPTLSILAPEYQSMAIDARLTLHSELLVPEGMQVTNLRYEWHMHSTVTENTVELAQPSITTTGASSSVLVVRPWVLQPLDTYEVSVTAYYHHEGHCQNCEQTSQSVTVEILYLPVETPCTLEPSVGDTNTTFTIDCFNPSSIVHEFVRLREPVTILENFLPVPVQAIGPAKYTFKGVLPAGNYSFYVIYRNQHSAARIQRMPLLVHAAPSVSEPEAIAQANTTWESSEKGIVDMVQVGNQLNLCKDSLGGTSNCSTAAEDRLAKSQLRYSIAIKLVVHIDTSGIQDHSGVTEALCAITGVPNELTLDATNSSLHVAWRVATDSIEKGAYLPPESFAEAVSNALYAIVANDDGSDETAGQMATMFETAVNTIALLAAAISSGKVPGEPGSVVQVSAFLLYTQRRPVNEAFSAISADGGSVDANGTYSNLTSPLFSLPQSALNTSVLLSVEVTLVVYNLNPYPIVLNNTNMSSNAVQLELYDESRAAISVNGLAEDITIAIPHEEMNESDPRVVVLCQFYNTTLQAWSGVGCYRDAIESSPTLTICKCNHLTTFGVFRSINFDQVVSDLGGNIRSNPGLIIFVCIIVALYLVLLPIAIRRDRRVATPPQPAEPRSSSVEMGPRGHVPDSLEDIRYVGDGSDGPDEKAPFVQQLGHNFRTKHLYISSVVALPPSERGFTSVMRLTCCLTTLLASLGINAAVYEKYDFDQAIDFLLALLSGIIAALIVFPGMVVITEIFRHSAPTSGSLDDDALRRRQSNPAVLGPNAYSAKAAERMRTGQLHSESGSQLTCWQRYRQFRLPTYWTAIAYFLCFAICAGSIFVIVIWGYSFESDLYEAWLVSSAVSIAQSILITQTLKVFVVTAVGSWCNACRRRKRNRQTRRCTTVPAVVLATSTGSVVTRPTKSLSYASTKGRAKDYTTSSRDSGISSNSGQDSLAALQAMMNRAAAESVWLPEPEEAPEADVLDERV